MYNCKCITINFWRIKGKIKGMYMYMQDHMTNDTYAIVQKRDSVALWIWSWYKNLIFSCWVACATIHDIIHQHIISHNFFTHQAYKLPITLIINY